MTIIFDLDDTLFPEMDFVRSAYRALAVRYGLHLLERLESAATPALAFDMIDADIKDVLDVYRYHKPSIKLPASSLFVLDTLSHQGHKLGLITDGRSITQRAKIEALNLQRFINADLIKISEEVGSDKLSGEALNEIIGQNKKESHFVYVGDNPAKDFLMPNKYGWHTIMIKNVGNSENIYNNDITGLEDKYMPKLVINNMWELPEVIRKIKRM